MKPWEICTEKLRTPDGQELMCEMLNQPHVKHEAGDRRGSGWRWGDGGVEVIPLPETPVKQQQTAGAKEAALQVLRDAGVIT